MEAEQTELEQSVETLQESPLAQGEQRAPPQSRSVSSWLRTPSLQVGAWQMEAEQTELEQSVAMAQESPLAQGEQRAPPQSRSDSS